MKLMRIMTNVYNTNLIEDPRLWILQMSEGRIRDTKGTANRQKLLTTIQH